MKIQLDSNDYLEICRLVGELQGIAKGLCTQVKNEEVRKKCMKSLDRINVQSKVLHKAEYLQKLKEEMA